MKSSLLENEALTGTERATDLADDADTRPTGADADALGLRASSRPLLLVAEREHRLYPLEPEKIHYIESAGNYVTIRAGDAQYIRRDSIKHLASALAGYGFVRIERSLLLNLRSVLYVERLGRGTFSFTLVCGVNIQSSASYREAILRALQLSWT